MSVRPEAIVFDLLNAHLAGLALFPVLPIAWPMVAFTPPPSGMWLEANPAFAATNDPWMANAAPAEHLGLMQITVCAQLGQGAAASIDVAGLVSTHFAKGTRLLQGATEVRIYTHSYIATPYKDELSLRTPVIARWRAIF